MAKRASWLNPSKSIRLQFLVSGAYTVFAVSEILLYVFGHANRWSLVLGVIFLLLSVTWLAIALGARRRDEQRRYHQVSPVPAQEILALMEQGQKIQAIKRYRELNPGIGLKQAKDVIDGL